MVQKDFLNAFSTSQALKKTKYKKAANETKYYISNEIITQMQ